MFVPTVTVFYEHSASGRTALAAAFDLLRRLGSRKLRVLVPQLLGVETDANTVMSSRIRSGLFEIAGSTDFDITVEKLSDTASRFSPATDLVVTNSSVDGFDNVNVFVSFDEPALDNRGIGPLVFPFGNGESGLGASHFALPLASALGLKVEFYHTTWNDPRRADRPANEHMCASAISLRAKLEARARELGITFDTTIETADDVAEGLIRFSMRKHACLIAMARGRHTGRAGSYVTQVLEQSPIPLLVCGRTIGGSR